MELFEFGVILFIWTTISQVRATLLEQLNFFVNQNRYTMQPNTFQTEFSLETVMGASLELALQSCQQDFEWERWNCPSTDFFVRSTQKRYQIDREDSYVTAIVTAAALYTITKDCASGVISGCGCKRTKSPMIPCSDDPDEALKLYEKHTQVNFGNDFRSLMKQHNFKAVSTLLRQSLMRQCGCFGNDCSEENCVNVLRPFGDIARDIKLMYDESLQLTNIANTQIMWSNIPLDSLVYATESPNYCELDAIPQWPGMHGRQCLNSNDEENENNNSCQRFCHECGYHVHTQNIVTEHSCNCKFTWNFQVQCEVCMNVEQQYYCY